MSTRYEMNNIWQQLAKPIFVLAPMEDVTDSVFRQIVADCGKPDLFMTEFTSADGLCSPGKDKVGLRLQYTEKEKPLIAQIWGAKPENFYTAAKMLTEMGFAGIDINMGCPVKKIVKHGGCSALIAFPQLAKEVIQATKGGAGDLPVSVKTRIGTKTIVTEEWIGFLLEQGLAALTIHARTVKEMSLVPAHWDEIGKAVQVRNQMKVETLIIGNGDVKSREEALEKVERFGVDGVMIGRGIFENPWLFSGTSLPADAIALQAGHQALGTSKERLELLLRHAKLFEETWGRTKNFAILRRFFKIYVKDFEGASELRAQLMETHCYDDVETLVRPYLSQVLSSRT